jgi:hypothetical protein
MNGMRRVGLRLSRLRLRREAVAPAFQGRRDPPARPVAQCIDGGVRHPPMGRLVQQSSLTRTDRRYPPAEAEALYSAPANGHAMGA